MTALTTAAFADIVSFTRASSGTYWGEDGLLATAATNGQRLEWQQVSALAGLSVQRRTLTLSRGLWSLGMTGGGSVVVRIAGRVVTTATSATRRRLYVRADDTDVEFTPLGTVTAWDIRRSLGLLTEEQRINIALYNRDLTNAAWTKTNITAALDQTGIDGAANAASSIEATAGNGTILQSITSTSAARFTTAYVRRLTGSGVIEMTQNGGSTWTAVTVTTDWTRVSIPTATLADPEVGFRIVTSGDKIAVDFVQCESGIFATSAVATTSAAVTRAADVIIVTGDTFTQFFGATEGTIFADFDTLTMTGNRFLAQASDNSYSNRILSGFNDNVFLGQVVASGSATLQPTSAPLRTNIGRIAFAYQANNANVAANGQLATADTSGALPSGLTRFNLGSDHAGFNRLNGHVRVILFHPRRWADAQLQDFSA